MERAAEIRRLRRVAVVLVLLVAIVVPYVVLLSVLWSNIGTDVRLAQRERDGVTFLIPTAHLLGVVTDAQTAAVNGRKPNAEAVLAAIPAVDQVDSSLGARLGTQERWAEVRTRLQTVLNAPGTGPAAYANFTQAVDLISALITSVADSSNLIRDPDVDAYYAIDATVVRIPAIIVGAGRLNDLTVLAARRGASATTIAITVDGLQRQAAIVDTGLRTSFTVTQSRTLGPALLSGLDRFRDAVTALVPPVAAVNGAPPTPSAATLNVQRAQVHNSALALESAAFPQIDALLVARRDHFVAQQRLVVAVTIGGAIIAIIALWLASPRRRNVIEDEDLEEIRPEGGPEPRSPELVEALQLMEARRLARVGAADSSTGETR